MQHRLLGIAIVMVWTLMLIGAIWLIHHPEAIGSWAGRVVTGAERVK